MPRTALGERVHKRFDCNCHKHQQISVIGGAAIMRPPSIGARLRGQILGTAANESSTMLQRFNKAAPAAPNAVSRSWINETTSSCRFLPTSWQLVRAAIERPATRYSVTSQRSASRIRLKERASKPSVRAIQKFERHSLSGSVTSGRNG